MRATGESPDFRALFESAPALVLALQPDAPRYTIVAVSDAYAGATMTRREEILGRGLFEVFPDNPEDPEASGTRNLAASLKRVIESRAPDAMAVQKYDIRRPDEEGGGFEERWWSPVNSPVLGPDGELIYILHRVEDVTEFVRLKDANIAHQRRTEELQTQTDTMASEIFKRGQEIQEVNRRLRSANDEITRLYEKTKELDEVKSRFFASISHELRTPLALILGPARRLLEFSEIGDRYRDDLGVIVRNARLLHRHVDDLLDVAKLEAGQTTTDYAETDLAQLARFVGGLFEVLASENDLQFTLEIPDQLWAEVDPAKLHRVLVNLLSNAFKFTPGGGRVRLSLRARADRAVIEIGDSGPGIPADKRAAVFERFRQLEGGSTRRFGGTGLGLSIARELTTLHGGTISVGDAPEGGALFHVELPRSAPPGAAVRARTDGPSQLLWGDEGHQAIEALRPGAAASPQPAGDPGDSLVLVVEDNREMNRFICETLAGRYRVAAAFDGQEGLDKAVALQPDLIVTDVMMPEMSGDALVAALRAHPELSQTPVVVLTAKADEALRVRLLGVGAQDYLTKPFSATELRARVNNLIEARDRQREAVLESEQRYQAIFENAPFAIALTKMPEATTVAVNEAFLELFGLGPDEVLGKTSVELDISDPDSRDRVRDELRREGTVRDFECVRTTRSGDRRHLSLNLDSVTIGGREHILTTIRDVTEHRRADRQLRESEARFRQIADCIDDVFLLHDRAERRVIYANPAFATIWGRPVSELYEIGAGWLEWVHRDDRDRVVERYRELFRGGSYDEEYRICRPDGEVRWLRARAYPVVEDDGPVRRDVVVIQDVTSERKLAEELRQAQKMEAVGALATGVAHDFGNVLQAVLGCVNLARDAETSRDALHYLDRAASAAKRGGDLASQLMAFSHKQMAAPRPLEIDAAIRDVAPLIRGLVTEQITVEVEPGAPASWIVADKVQIEQVLMNLAANARDAMPEGGLLSIATDVIEADDPELCHLPLESPRGYVRLAVRDHGVGMDEATRARIFEPFFTTKEVGKGTGLGLSTVFAVTRQLGGHIDVFSEEGQGTTFALYFPRCEPEAAETAAPRELVHLAGTALLVEDEPLVRMTVGYYLEKLGLEVLEAEDADQALQMCELHRGPIDVLVSDVVLPIMRGPRLASLLVERYPDIRVLFMSANPELTELEGRVDQTPVLHKPFGERDLTRALVELLGDRVVVREPAPPRAGPAARRSGRPQPARERTILVVEDEPTSRMALGDLLGLHGYRVLLAATPSEALALAGDSAAPVDLLLTDLRLPEIGGEELAARLRRSQPGVEVVFMSGSPDAPIGATFIRKPIDLDVLLVRLEQALGD